MIYISAVDSSRCIATISRIAKFKVPRCYANHSVCAVIDLRIKLNASTGVELGTLAVIAHSVYIVTIFLLGTKITKTHIAGYFHITYAVL